MLEIITDFFAKNHNILCYRKLLAQMLRNVMNVDKNRQKQPGGAVFACRTHIGTGFRIPSKTFHQTVRKAGLKTQKVA